MPAIRTAPTVADLASQSMAAVRVFEKYGIDYCCGGKRPLADVCREKNIDPAQLERELGDAKAEPASARDWNAAPLSELTRHIVATHHEYLKLELPRLAGRMSAVLNAHGPKDPGTLNDLSATLQAVASELDLHMHKEEAILFPFIERYWSAVEAGQPLPPTPFGTVANPIAMMEHEHDSAGQALARIRRLTGDFALPEYACNTVRALWKGLEEMEADLHLHIHLENNILHPRVLKLERDQAGRRE